MIKSNTLNVNGQALPKTKGIKGFTQIANAAILDQRLSFKARGILALLLSRPANWQIYVKELTNRSDKDGLRAVQTGLKELSTLGYVELVPVYNNELGRFAGTFYRLNEQLFLPRPTHFLNDCHTDGQEATTAAKEEVTSAARLQSRPHTNTDLSNKKDSNTQQQQQEEAAPAELIDIEQFLPQLSKDQQWQRHFIGQSLGQGNLLDQKNFEILLRHFQQTSLQHGQRYPSLEDCKRHFANWFNTNLNQGKLPEFIQTAKVQRRQAAGKFKSLIIKASSIFQLLKTRNCNNVQQVLALRKQLLHYREQLSTLLPYLPPGSGPSEATTAIENINQLTAQIDRGYSAQQLDWYCANCQ